MRLYLVQHGDALPKEVDPDRVLSEKGVADVIRIGCFLRSSGVRVARIWHSGKKRAQQTADLIAAQIEPPVNPAVLAGLDPNDATGELVSQLSDWNEDALIVGHMPSLGRLVSRLACGHEESPPLAFRPGTVLCLERDAAGPGWSIAWMIRPELLAPAAASARTAKRSCEAVVPT